MRLVVGAFALVGLALTVVTALALEGREVVVVETTDASGSPRRTRTWIADEAGSSWIEAASPERPFLHDLDRDPRLVLERGGARRRCTAEIAPNPQGHARIRRLLAARYGWADRWVAYLADTSRSLAVRLTCA